MRGCAPDWLPRMEPVDWALLAADAALAAALALAFDALAGVLGVR